MLVCKRTRTIWALARLAGMLFTLDSVDDHSERTLRIARALGRLADKLR